MNKILNILRNLGIYSLILGGFLGPCLEVQAMVDLSLLIGAVNHLQTSTMAKWGEQIGNVQQQLEMLRDQKRALDDQLHTQREQFHRIQEYVEFFGNPRKAFGENLSWKTIDIDDVLRNARGLTEVLQDPLKGIRRATEVIPGIYEQIPQTTSYGTEVPYTPEVYARYSVVDQDVERVANLNATYHAQREKLYRDLEQCMRTLKDAKTDAEVQKLHAHINAINGQIALLESYRGEANDQLQVHALHVQNQSEKEVTANVELSLQERLDEGERFDQLASAVRFRRRAP